MRSLFLLLFILYINNVSGQDWTHISSGQKTIGSVHMADSSTIYITVENKIYKSIDRANTWEMVWESDSKLKSVFTTSTSKTGRLYSAYDQFQTNWSKLIYSDDGGKTWEEQSAPFYVNEPGLVYFHNNDVGFVGGDDRLVMTEDGGKTWKTVASKNGMDFNTIQFLTDSIGIIAGGAEPRSFLLRTVDGGKTWNDVSAPGIDHYRAQFPTEKIGYVVSLNKVSKSIDGGKTWSSLDMPKNEVYFQVYFPTADFGYVFTSDFLNGGWDYGSTVYKTIDGGMTWVEEKVNQDQLYRIHDIDFNGRFGVMVGARFGIYITEIDHLLESKEITKSNQITRVYPNPVQDVLNVKVDDRSIYKIYSTDGILMKSGSIDNSVIDVADLQQGNYILLLSSNLVTSRTSFIKI